jgi:hypothetical protein
MLKAKQSILRETTRPSANTVAQALRQQFDRIPDSLFHSHSAMFLKDAFALGYYFGFAEEASRDEGGMQSGDLNLDYVNNVLGDVLGNPSAVSSFIAFADCLRNDISFQKGFEAGLIDLETWRDSNGVVAPTRLARYFGASRQS